MNNYRGHRNNPRQILSQRYFTHILDSLRPTQLQFAYGNRTLMLFGVLELALSSLITNSGPSSPTRVAAVRWLVYCVSVWKPKLTQASLATHLQTNWPKYCVTSVGWGEKSRTMLTEFVHHACVCVFVKSHWPGNVSWQRQWQNNNVSQPVVRRRNFSISPRLELFKKKSILLGTNSQRTPSWEIKTKKEQPGNITSAFFIFFPFSPPSSPPAPCDAVATQRLTGCIRESLSEGWLT